MMNPNTGGVIAMIGGNDYNKSEYNRATKAKRQVGSTMKPLLYYTALESGFTASSSFTSKKQPLPLPEIKHIAQITIIIPMPIAQYQWQQPSLTLITYMLSKLISF